MNFSGGQTADGEPKEEWIEDELGRLDMDLLRKSKQHNLTSNNVRAILHVSVSSLTYTHWRRCVRCVFVIPQEVITHEHVVSMMKAAIRDTQDQPMFVSPPLPLTVCCMCVTLFLFQQEPKMTRSRLKQSGHYSQVSRLPPPPTTPEDQDLFNVYVLLCGCSFPTGVCQWTQSR